MSPENDGNEREKLSAKLRWHRIVTPLAGGVALAAIFLNGWTIANQRTIITPPVMQRSYWVSAHEADKAYIEDMSDFVLTNLKTVTPGNVGFRSQRILKMVLPEKYGEMASRFKAQEEKIKREEISSVWEPASGAAADGALCAKWTGKLRRWVGEKPLPPESKTFLVEFEIDRQGTLYVKTADEYTPELAASSACQ